MQENHQAQEAKLDISHHPWWQNVRWMRWGDGPGKGGDIEPFCYGTDGKRTEHHPENL